MSPIVSWGPGSTAKSPSLWTLGKRAWLHQRKANRDIILTQLSRRFGVFNFYSSSCGACDIFSPIPGSVSDKYGLSVLAVLMDGGPSPVFPDYMIDSGQHERLGLPEVACPPAGPLQGVCGSVDIGGILNAPASGPWSVYTAFRLTDRPAGWICPSGKTPYYQSVAAFASVPEHQSSKQGASSAGSEALNSAPSE